MQIPKRLCTQFRALKHTICTLFHLAFSQQILQVKLGVTINIKEWAPADMSDESWFCVRKWKEGLFYIPQSGHESVYLLEPSFHSRTPNNSTFMKNISWCPCLKVRVNFYLRRNNAAHFTVVSTLRKSSGNKMMPSYRHLRPVLVLPPPVTTLPPPISQWVSKLSKLWTSR